MGLSNVISLLGGVALFLFGMTLMGDGLKKVAGSRLELVLYRLSGTTLKGILLGTGVTAVIQSSSATSVMAVGFVNSGMMKLTQALAVVSGAIIGTSITGWIIALSSIEAGGWAAVLSTANISAATAIVGVVLRMFSKDRTRQNVGSILLGFAVLMFGMQSMSAAVAPLRESEVFIRMITAFSDPVLGILAGAAFTAVLQSSSAAVGILQALSMTGAVSFAAAFPLILGIAVGAAVPVLLSALGAKADGKRTAVSYLIISVLGTVVCGGVFYAVNAFNELEIMSVIVDPVSIALLNTVFRTATVLAVAPFLDQLARLTGILIKESEEEKSASKGLDRLDERFLAHPSLAIEQSRLTVDAMSDTVRDNLDLSLRMMDGYCDESFRRVETGEDLVDRFEDKLGTYLLRLNTHELDKEQNKAASKLLHCLSDFERIGDHAMNLAENAREISGKKIQFSPDCKRELGVLMQAVREIYEISFKAFHGDDVELAYRVEPLEERIDNMCDLIKLRHVERLQSGEIPISQGFVFNDILTNLERVADHCSNLAVAVIELQQDEMDAHEYIISLKSMHSHNFDELYAEYSRKYAI